MTTDPTTINVSFGYWVRRRRKALDLTQEQLAERASCSNALIRKIENDERRPSKEIAELLAKALEISPDEQAAFLKVARGERATTLLAQVAEAKSAAPPQLVAPPVRSNLPLAPNPLVGRVAELMTLNNLLHDGHCRLLTITGAGGMGKTRLAIELAQQARADFADGVFFVNLAAVARNELIAPAIATAIGLNFSGPAQHTAQLLGYLCKKHMLLLLDNFEHLLEGADIVGELLLTAPNLKVLATSREPLGLQAEWVFTLDGLALTTGGAAQPDAAGLASALELFVQRASQAQVGFRLTTSNAAAVQRICQLVEGLPLAIELAATWVRTLSCTEIAQQIEQGIDFLVTTARDLPARHRSITAVFDHSWRLLNGSEQQTLAQLAVFQGGFTREAAQIVAGASLLTLSALVSKSLVRVVAGRYDLHELVRQFVATQLSDKTLLTAAQRRHTEYYLALLHAREATLKGVNQLQVIDELKRELGNLRQAWALAAQFELWGLLFLAIRGYWAFFDLQGLAREGSSATELLIQQMTAHQTDRPEMQRTLGRLFCYCGFFYFRQGDNGPAHTYLERSIQLLRTLDDPALLIDPLIFHGVVLFLMGRLADAEAELQEGLAYAQAAHEEWFEALALLNRGYLAMFVEATPVIYAEMQTALAIWRRMGGLRTIALALNYLSPVAILLGHLTDAQHFLDECLRLAEQISDRWLIGTAYSHQAMLAQAQGNLARAEDAYQQAITLFQEMQLLRDLCVAQVFLGEVQMERGAPTLALQTLGDGLRLALRVGAVPTVLAALLDLAALPDSASPELRLLLIAFVQQHPVKTQRLIRDVERLWAQWAALFSPLQIQAIEAQAQRSTLEQIAAEALANRKA
jgi:predicted ATPase/transcriptional regulator with XRE-family HTH domain